MPLLQPLSGSKMIAQALMVELPYEIWTYIASILPRNVLFDVFSVNRAFFNYALDLRYHAIQFGEFPNPQSFMMFKRLKDPKLALRVRELTLRPTTLSQLPLKIRSSRVKPSAPLPSKRFLPWKATIQRLDDTLGLPRRFITTNDVLNIMSNVKRVTTFTIDCSEPDINEGTWYSRCVELQRIAWSSFGSSLQTLVLNVPANILCYETSLSFPTEVLPQLREVIFQFSCIWEVSALFYNPVTTSLSPFLNKHSSQLRNMTLNVNYHHFDIARFFGSLDTFPALTNLSVSQTSESAHQDSISTEIQNFIWTRAPALRHLTLKLHTRLLGPFFTYEPSDNSQAPPQLQKLDIHFRFRPDETPGDRFFKQFLTYTSYLVPSLVELDANNITLSIDQFKKIVNIFHLSTALSSLHLTIDELEPEVFVYTADQLPLLQRFTVGYVRLRPNLFPQDVVGRLRLPTFEFVRAMETHDFSHWGLRHLHIQPQRHWPWISCKHAVANVFPNVRTFNGASREEYLSRHNMDNI